MFAATHGLGIRPVQPAAADEAADDPLPDRRLKSLQAFRGEAQLPELQCLGIFSRKHAVADDRVMVALGIEQPANAVDKDDGVNARLGFAVCVRPALSQASFDGVQKTVEHGVLQLGVVDVIAQAFGEREQPSSYRQARKDMIDEIRRRSRRNRGVRARPINPQGMHIEL